VADPLGHQMLFTASTPCPFWHGLLGNTSPSHADVLCILGGGCDQTARKDNSFYSAYLWLYWVILQQMICFPGVSVSPGCLLPHFCSYLSALSSWWKSDISDGEATYPGPRNRVRVSPRTCLLSQDVLSCKARIAALYSVFLHQQWELTLQKTPKKMERCGREQHYWIRDQDETQVQVLRRALKRPVCYHS